MKRLFVLLSTILTFYTHHHTRCYIKFVLFISTSHRFLYIIINFVCLYNTTHMYIAAGEMCLDNIIVVTLAGY